MLNGEVEEVTNVIQPCNDVFFLLLKGFLCKSENTD
uniref:Bm14444 n=1 Tax=Brugia malayi TaxID=6279 RepID=A0A1I9G6A4_BRUMA|nr:Bm14444 [Brugia malayi]